MLASLTLALVPALHPAQELRPYPFDLAAHPEAPREDEILRNLAGEEDDLFLAIESQARPQEKRILVYRRVAGRWQRKPTLRPLTHVDGEEVVTLSFGHSMAFEGDLALVHASYVSTTVPLFSGTVHVLRRQGEDWLPAGFVGPTVGRPGFGHNLSISNGTALVGTRLSGWPTELQAWHFEEGRWVPELIEPQDGRLLVGRIASHGGGSLIGTLALQYLERANGIWRIERLPGSFVDTRSVALCGSRALAGVKYSGGGHGLVAYERDATGWHETQALWPELGSRTFGFESAMNGEWAFASEPSESRLHAYRRVEGEWRAWGNLPGHDQVSAEPRGGIKLRADGEVFAAGVGSPPTLFHYRPSFDVRTTGVGNGQGLELDFEPEPGVVARVSGTEVGRSGFLLVSPLGVERPLPAGTLWIGAPRRALFFRTGESLPVLRAAQERPGRTLHLQAFVPDPAAPGGVRMSRGVELTLQGPVSGR